MTSMMHDIASEVARRINAGTYAFGTVLSVVEYDTDELPVEACKSLRVTVVPTVHKSERLTRESRLIHQAVDVAIRKQCDPDDNTAVDQLLKLMEEITARLTDYDFTLGGTSLVQGDIEILVEHAPRHLRQTKVFFALRRFHWEYEV